jgi:hypothetical protein
VNNTRKKEKNYFELSETLYFSVADPGCLSRIPDPDFYPSRIRDLGSKTAKKERGENFFFVKPFFVATKFKIILFLKC